MAWIRTARRFRWAPALVIVAATGLALLPGGASAEPERPTPSVGSVTARLDKLANRAEALTEQFNAAAANVTKQRRAVAAAQRASHAADAAFGTARRELAEISLAQYEGGSFSRTGAMLSSTGSENYLDTLATQDMLSAHSADVVSTVSTARTRAERARAAASSLLAAARATKHRLAIKRQQVDAQTKKYQAILSTLTATQQLAYTTRDAVPVPQANRLLSATAATAAAQKAVDFALAQVGKPYVWAASGPDSFDCSGLTMAAWARGGVSLPHFAAAQYQYGTHIGYDQLQPGDLVFLYGDLHHVEIYVGNGLAVSAPQPGENVQIVRVADSRADYYGAVRLG